MSGGKIRNSKFRSLVLLSKRLSIVRYKRDKLNLIWIILEPTIITGAYWYLITVISEGRVGIEPYSLFLASGILPWLWFSKSIKDSSSTLQSNAKLMNSLGVPKLMWPLPPILSRFFEFLIGYLVLLGFFATLAEIRPTVIWLIPTILAQAVLMIAILYVLIPVVVLVPDFARIITLSLRIGFFVTPILYAKASVPSYMYHWLQFNPLTHLMEFYRYSLFESSVSNDSLQWFVLVTCTLLVIGLVTYYSLHRMTLKELN